MEKLLQFLSGYVLVWIKGEQLERFLNLCRGRGITLRKIKAAGEKGLTAFLSIEDFFKLRPLRSKTGVHICVRKKYGMPFFLHRNKKRKAFFLGLLLCLGLLAALSSHIWNIHIEGNVINSTPEILGFLEEQGISHGIAKRKVSCYGIAALVREKYPEITWVSARMEGTRLILTVKEGKTKAFQEEEKETPCSLFSTLDGVIAGMVTRKGTPQVRTGDSCKKGDLLVLGRVDIKNDSQEVVRQEYVHADADIYVRHELAYYREFPMQYQAQARTGESRSSFYVKAGPWFLEMAGPPGKNWRRVVTEEPWRLTENFVLPVSIGLVRDTRYETVKAVYSKEQARKRALKELQLYEKDLTEKGIEITGNHVKIETDEKSCISRGTLTVIEKTGEKRVLEKEKTKSSKEGEAS